MYVAIIGLALTALTGCGIGHGPYRHGYTGYNDVGNNDGYRNNVPYSTMHGPAGGGYHRHTPGYSYGGGGYCGW